MITFYLFQLSPTILSSVPSIKDHNKVKLLPSRVTMNFLMERPDALKPKDSSLVNAAREGDVQALKLLLNEGIDVDHQDSVGSSTALMTAANWGNSDCVEFLLSRGAKIDMQDKDGRTPLIFAVTMTRTECVKVLVVHGADPNRCSKNGWSPLYIACNKGSTEIVEILVSFPYATRHGVNKINIDIPNSVGTTSLMVASMHGHMEIVNILMRQRADVNMRDLNRWNAVMKVADKGNTEVVSILIEHGADVTASDNSGFSSLALAAKAGKEATVRALLDSELSKPDINFADKNGRTALFYAAQNGHLEAVRELWSRGADVTIRDKNGNTALSVAKVETVICLLQYKPPVATKPVAPAPAPVQPLDPVPMVAIELGPASLLVPSVLSGEKSGNVEGAVDDALLQTQMGGLTFSSTLTSSPSALPLVHPPAGETNSKMEVESGEDITRKRKATKSPPTAHKSGLHMIEFSKIPAYLHSSDLYMNFDGEQDDTISVPADCYRLTDDVETAEDFKHLLNVVMFWCFTKLPPGLMAYCATNTPDHWEAETARSFGKDSPWFQQLTKEFGSQPPLPTGPLTLEYADIPAYLHSSALYLSLDKDSEDPIQVPAGCFLPRDVVQSVEDLRQALHVMLFWALNMFTLGVVRFCAAKPLSEWDNVAAEVLHPESKLLEDLRKIFVEDGSPLVRAIETDHVECVKYLVEMKCHHDSAAPLASAAASGMLPYIMLLQKGKYPRDATTTAAAAGGGYVECLSYLHEHGCPCDASTHIAAARGGHVECMRYAVDHGLDQWSAEVCSAAADGGHLDCLRFAREKGCPWDDNVTLKATEKAVVLTTSLINPADFEETRRLEEQRCALEAGRFECLQFALLHNCPIHKDACTNAAAAGQLRSLQLLHDRDPPAPWNADSILAAVEAGSLECLTYLHRNRCPWDTRAPDAAAKRGDIACLRYCIGNWCPYDADLMRQAATAHTNSQACLNFLISEQGMYELLPLRIFLGLRSPVAPVAPVVEVVNGDIPAPWVVEMTPLMITAAAGQVAALSELLQTAGFAVNLQNMAGRTALSQAAENGHHDCVELLLRNMADPNLVSINRWSPLHYAAQKKYLGIMTTLLRGGALRDARNSAGSTPLMTCCKVGHTEGIALLLSAGADPSLGVEGGWSVLDVALSNDQVTGPHPPPSKTLCEVYEGCIIGMGSLRGEFNMPNCWALNKGGNTEGGVSPLTLTAMGLMTILIFTVDVFKNLFHPAEKVDLSKIH